MKNRRREHTLIIQWSETARELQLEEMPVLRWKVTAPKLEGDWRGLGAVQRYYDRLATLWRERWERELYVRACLDLAQSRADGVPFRVWEAALTAPSVWQGEGMLSLYQEAAERHGTQRQLVVPMGDTWSLDAGAPIPLSALFPGERRWRERLLDQVEEQARARVDSGLTFLERGCLSRLRELFSPRRFYLTGESLVLFYPMYTLAPGGEGVPAFPVPRTGAGK